MVHPPHFSWYTPPLSLYQKISGRLYHEKRPKLAPQTGSENRVARNVE